MDGKCQAVWDWSLRFKEEYPHLSTSAGNWNSHIAEIANLYRNDYFEPVFGFPYRASNAPAPYWPSWEKYSGQCTARDGIPGSEM
jgi:hypothetical protein